MNTLALWAGAFILAGLADGRRETDLRVTDSRGTEVVVSGALIDYGGFWVFDKQTDGIRVMQGDGTATLKWSDVDTLYVRAVDEKSDPPTANLEIVLRNRRRVAAGLLWKGHMQLSGRTELGDYTINLLKIRRIVPTR